MRNSSRIAIAGTFVPALVGALYLGRYLMVPLTAAVLPGMTLGPVTDRLTRRGLPAPPAPACFTRTA